MCLQAVRNQWDILYIYVKIFIFMIFVFFSSYPVYINLLLRYCENYKIKLKSYDSWKMANGHVNIAQLR